VKNAILNGAFAALLFFSVSCGQNAHVTGLDQSGSAPTDPNNPGGSFNPGPRTPPPVANPPREPGNPPGDTGNPTGNPPGTPPGTPPGRPPGTPPGYPPGTPPGTPPGNPPGMPPQKDPTPPQCKPIYEHMHIESRGLSEDGNCLLNPGQDGFAFELKLPPRQRLMSLVCASLRFGRM
jgi:hypothetical protein